MWLPNTVRFVNILRHFDLTSSFQNSVWPTDIEEEGHDLQEINERMRRDAIKRDSIQY